MLLRECMTEIKELRYIVEELSLSTGVGRQQLLSRSWSSTACDIEQRLQDVEEFYEAYRDTQNAQIFSLLPVRLSHVLDVSGTIAQLGQRALLTDIDFFQIKSLALQAQGIAALIAPLQLDCVQIPCLQEVISVLDPEGKQIPHFYIYSLYSDRLAELRTQLTVLINNEASEDAIEELRSRAEEEEDRVRALLVDRLAPFAKRLECALQQLGYLDILFAQAQQIAHFQFIRPQIGSDATTYRGLFSPQLLELLAAQGKKFQPIDITIQPTGTLIMGSNMAGKSVLLRSVALAQVLCQYGFFVPAQSATIVPVDRVALLAGDAEDVQQGLSSYAAEMLRLNVVLEHHSQGVKQLVLIDELARTTNPVEGAAIVGAVMEYLTTHHILSLVTTHYALHTMECRKLRVKGFVGTEKDMGLISVHNIGNYIDYSLEEITAHEVPQEAVRIAQIIGVSPQLVANIKKHLSHTS